jgi:hypothetical protein
MLVIARLIALGARPASKSAITVSDSSIAAAATSSASAARDRRAQPERRTALIRHQVHVVDHAEQAPSGGEDGQVADAVVEHLEQRLGRRPLGRDGPRRGGHDLGQRRLRPGAGRHHAGADVTVGHDPEPVAGVDHDAGGARLGHLPRRLLHARGRWADERRRPDQLAHRAARRRQRRLCLVTGEEADALVHHPRHEPNERRALQDRADHVPGDPVDERVLRGPRHEADRLLRQHRREAEQLALAHQVQQAALDDELDGAAPDYEGVRRGPRAAVEDRGARSVKLDLGAARHGGERLVIERVEWHVGAQKVSDVLHLTRTAAAGIFAIMPTAPLP